MGNQPARTDLLIYKQIELDNSKNLKFFLEKHSTKEGTWGQLTVHKGAIEFSFQNGQGDLLSHHFITSESPALTIPPASWHKIVSTSLDFKGTLNFLCQPHRYFEKKYRLSPLHHDLWNIYQTYLQGQEKMSILDVGCGSGRNPLYFALSDHQVTGIDKDEKSIENVDHISKKEQLLNLETHIHDLNHPLAIKDRLFNFIYSTVTLQFLKPSSIKPLLTQMQSLTSNGGMHFLVFPIKSEVYSYPESFTYLAEPNELYQFYQDSGWSILEYKEKPGHLHRLDEHGKPKDGLFGQLLAQKYLS